MAARTIRDYLKRRYLRETLISICLYGTALLFFAVAAFRHRPSTGWIVTLVVLTIWVWFAWMRGVRCPRCSRPLGKVAIRAVWGTVKQCPHCGASFDEQMPDPSRS